MKVKLKDVKPNPYRHLESYPIDTAKVERLKKSIKHTGFWDNIVGRQVNGHVQIAYGHHRLAALKKAYPSTHVIEIINKKLDDATMIKMMADENDESYNMLPSVINETVKVARDYLAKTSNERETKIIAQQVSSFLNWPIGRVLSALMTINAIESQELVPEVEELPSQSHVTEFRNVAKGMTPAKQRKAIKIIKERTEKGEIGHRGVRDEVLNIKMKSTPKKDKNIDLLEYLYKEMSPMVCKLNRKLDELGPYRQYFKGAEGFLFWNHCKELNRTLNGFLNNNTVQKQAAQGKRLERQ